MSLLTYKLSNDIRRAGTNFLDRENNRQLTRFFFIKRRQPAPHKGEIFLNIKSNVLKSVFAAGLALTGVAAISLGTNGQADAATVGESVTVDYIDGQSIATWSNYHTASVTGSVKDGSSWRVVKTAHDASGEKWYKIGRRQWIMAKYTTEATANSTYQANTSSYTANTAANTTGSTSYSTNYSSSASGYGYGSNYNYSYRANTGSNNTSTYSAPSTATASASTTSSTSSSSEEAAKAWIASKESGGSYTASNGNYYGKYQLSKSYLNGDTSAANQEKVANSYVQSRYGSWTAAKAFWQANGWY